MIAIPALDLRHGGCLRWVGEEVPTASVRVERPVAVARDLAQDGFTRLHVTDLDAAVGQGSNRQLIRELLFDRALDIQVGGGLRDEYAVDDLMSDGAASVIVGTRALADPGWLGDLADTHPGAIIVAVDAFDRQASAPDRPRMRPHDVLDAVDDLLGLPLGGLLVTTDQARRVESADLHLLEDIVERCAFRVLAAVNVGSCRELAALEDRGVAGVILGAALQNGVLNARQVAQEFAA